jgi:post-segregation antitoxin (ccd killing protein)
MVVYGMSNKVVCSIYIDEEIKETAHALGLNISKITENRLREIIQKISPSELKKELPKSKQAQEVEEVF